MINIGSLPYLNAKPLIRGIIKNQFDDFDISYHIPSSLSSLLNMGIIDVGMLPIIDFFKNEDYRIIKNISIGSKGEVKSILFHYKKELEKIQNVALDVSSSTSSTLLRILLSKKYNVHPQFISVDFNLSSAKEIINKSDSFLIIGDQALNSEFNNFESLDLGQEWYEWTNLPFINAAWITRKGFHKAKLDQILLESKQYGLNNIDDIVNESINNFKLTKDELRDYLLKNIQYDLDTEEIKGINLFYKYAQELKLCHPDKELKFYGDD